MNNFMRKCQIILDEFSLAKSKLSIALNSPHMVHGKDKKQIMEDYLSPCQE